MTTTTTTITVATTIIIIIITDSLLIIILSTSLSQDVFSFGPYFDPGPTWRESWPSRRGRLLEGTYQDGLFFVRTSSNFERYLPSTMKYEKHDTTGPHNSPAD